MEKLFSSHFDDISLKKKKAVNWNKFIGTWTSNKWTIYARFSLAN
jgi:hypothetical protein